MKRRFFNIYLTTTVSVMLVLLLVGMGSILLLSADYLFRQVRQNVAIDVVLSADADSTALCALDDEFAHAAYAHDYRYISQDEALREHIATLGEDPTRFIGYNPLRASYEVHLSDAYANPDSASLVVGQLKKREGVERIVFQEEILTTMDKYVSHTMLVIAIGSLLLLLLAWALIMNMIRLQIYSQRFLIHTMTLVGATSWYIRRPFIRRSIVIGIVAAAMAAIALAFAVYGIRQQWGVVLFPFTWQNITFLLLVLFGTALLITFLASLLATGRYIRMKNSTLYEV